LRLSVAAASVLIDASQVIRSYRRPGGSVILSTLSGLQNSAEKNDTRHRSMMKFVIPK
jgi:hypothetical protein